MSLKLACNQLFECCCAWNVPKVVGGGSPTKQYDGLPNTAVQPILKPTPPYHPGLLKRRWLINFQASSPARGHLSFPRGGATCVLAVCRISGLGGMHLTQKCWGRIRLSPRRPQFNPPGHLWPSVFSWAGTFALFSRNDPAPLWRYRCPTLTIFTKAGATDHRKVV